MRFLENLAAWLQQFETIADRQEAYALLRHRLIYISPPELQRLVELFYPCTIVRRLVSIVAMRRNIPPYQVQVDKKARADFLRLRRRTLILGLSDGARIDILRHSNVGVLSNEQLVIQTQVDRVKWRSLVDNLRKSQGPDALFEVVFLVDDFMGTGSSFLRYDGEDKKWTGKLTKFLQSLTEADRGGVTVLADGAELCVHHYLSTQRAAASMPSLEEQARAKGDVPRGKASHYTFGTILEPNDCVIPGNVGDARLVDLTQRYYNPGIRTKHTDVGGVTHLGLGYGGCALPLVLHHNTPNNSLALIWAEIDSGPDEKDVMRPEMRPLFRRRQRHTE